MPFNLTFSVGSLVRELAAQDLRGLIALGFFMGYLVTAFLA